MSGPEVPGAHARLDRGIARPSRASLKGMEVIADADVIELIRQRGGRLYVWADPHKCCSGNMTYLITASERRAGRRFERFDADGFELWFDPGSLTPPDELHLDVKGWRKKRVEAYWNGCAFAI